MHFCICFGSNFAYANFGFGLNSRNPQKYIHTILYIYHTLVFCKNNSDKICFLRKTCNVSHYSNPSKYAFLYIIILC